MEKTDEISKLNTLIGHTLDSAEGYREGAEIQEEGRYAAHFSEMSDQRRALVGELQNRVRTLGGDPEDDSTVLGGMHRAWTFVKSKSTEGDQALVGAIEGGEEYLRDQYDEVLQEDLTPETRMVVEAGRAHAAQGYEKASGLKMQSA